MTNRLPKIATEKQRQLFEYGLRHRYSLLCADPRLGKAQPLMAKVLTPRGYISIGDLTTEDKVFGMDGSLKKIIGIHPQGYKKIFKVSFSDGTNTQCCDDHLWSVKTNNDFRKNKEWRVLPLKEIKKYLVETGGKRHWRIPISGPINFPKTDVPIDPYVLGVLIGDGSLLNGGIILCNESKFIQDKVIDLCGGNARSVGKVVRFTRSDSKSYLNEIRSLKLDVISQFKFVPDIYKFNCVDVRKEVLSGLLDTDGYVAKDGTLQFCSSSERLVDDVRFLIESLGGVARKIFKKAKCQTGVFNCWILTICPPDGLKLLSKPFKSSREKITRKYKPSRFITDVEFYGVEECACISVEDQHYLTNNCIVTHNSMVAIYLQKVRRVNCVIICPSYLILNWKKEIEKWNPKAMVTTFRKGKDIYDVFDTDFVVTSFELAKQSPHLFFWAEQLVIDECFTGDVEVFTDRGFVRFDSLNRREKIAQYDSVTEEISFTKPLGYTKRKYDGDIINMVSDKKINISVTPNHDMVAVNTKGITYKIKASAKIPNQHKFIKAGLACGQDSIITPWEKMAIAFQADGSWHYKKSVMSFSFSKDRKIKDFEKLLKECGAEYTNVSPAHLKKRYLVKVGGNNISKNIRDVFKISSLSLKKCKDIIEYMVRWDGSVISKNFYYYSSTVKDNRDFYQELCTLSGYSSNGTQQKDNRKSTYATVHRLFISKNKKYSTAQNIEKSTSKYRGNVYCVTVPSGNIIVRRDGKVIVCGNCHNLKSMVAKRTEYIHQQVYENSIPFVHGLTGTPLKNRVKEFYSLLALMNYNPAFGEKSDFLKKYPDEITFAEEFSFRESFDVKVTTKRGASFYMPVVRYTGLRNVKKLKKALKGVYIRIRADDKDLPPITYTDILIKDSADIKLLKAFEKWSGTEGNDSVAPNIKVEAALKKAPFTIKYAQNLLDGGAKCVLIYSDHTEPIKKIAAHFKVKAITGAMSGSNRNKMIKDFQDGKTQVLCATIGALKEGADLFRACDLVLNDYSWIPSDLIQVFNRMRKIGKKEPCNVHRIFGSPQDEKIFGVLTEKTRVIEAAT